MLVACEKNPTIDYEKPNIEPVDVYQIQQLSEKNELEYQINVYMDNPLVFRNNRLEGDFTREDILERVEHPVIPEEGEENTENVKGETSDERPLTYNMDLITEGFFTAEITRELPVVDEDGNQVIELVKFAVNETHTFSYVITGDIEKGLGSAVITTTHIKRVGIDADYEEEEVPNTVLTISGDMHIATEYVDF